MSGYGYFGKVFSAFSSALEFNTATLSGAIDIIVIEDDQGRRHCSPFHVRFGKLQLLKSRGIPVEIELNGQRTNLRMFLGAAGEAYFYNPSVAGPHESTDISTPEVSPHMSLGAEFESTLEEAALPARADSMPIFHPEIQVLGKTKDEIVMNSAGPAHLAESMAKDREQSSNPDIRRSELRRWRSTDSGIRRASGSRIKQTRDTAYPFGYISDSEVELTRNERAGTTEVVDEPRSPPLFPSQRKWSSTVAQNPPAVLGVERAQETEKGTAIAQDVSSGRPDSLGYEPTALEHPSSSSPNSESMDEREVLVHEKVSASVTLDTEKPESSRLHGAHEDMSKGRGLKEFDDAVMVSDTLSDIVGEEEAKLDCRSVDGYDADEDNVEDLQERVAFVLSKSQDMGLDTADIERSSKTKDGRYVRFESIEHRDHREPTIQREAAIDMSLCGSLIMADMSEPEIEELFDRHRVSFDEFSSNPNILYDPALLIRIDSRLVELRVAVPFIFAALAYNERMDVDTLAKLAASEEKREEPKSPPTPSRRFRWFGWGSPAVMGEPLLDEDDINTLEEGNETAKEAGSQGEKTDPAAAKSAGNEDPQVEEEAKTADGSKHDPNISEDARQDLTRAEGEEVPIPEEQESDSSQRKDVRRQLVDLGTDTPDRPLKDSQDELPTAIPQRSSISFSELDPDALSLRPSAEDLQSLRLLPGANTIRFFVESSSVELHCRIFLWSSHTKIVISDVDGTITRSDVLGHLLPAVGRDWSQVGVAGLYTQIEKNGYKLLYLTARPIGQASQTREFLRSVTQGSAKLPNGPVLMSPNRLVESFTREVIRRKPQEFKIAALREVRSLFSPDYNPFHAGFGNRDTDVISYRSVGLIPQRIFVVNPRGELVVTKAKYESTASYSTLQDLVESVFPDISRQGGLEKVKALTDSSMYNDWNYWRGVLPSVDIDELLESKKP